MEEILKVKKISTKAKKDFSKKPERKAEPAVEASAEVTSEKPAAKKPAVAKKPASKKPAAKE